MTDAAPWTEYLIMSDGEYSPTVIGPFKSQEQLDEFLNLHGRVFSSMVYVYTPEEYTQTCEDMSE